MAKYNPKQAHAGHPKRWIPLDRKSDGPGQHYGKVECRLCNTFVRWATKTEIEREICNGN